MAHSHLIAMLLVSPVWGMPLYGRFRCFRLFKFQIQLTRLPPLTTLPAPSKELQGSLLPVCLSVKMCSLL
jgi:hypothetical protein